MSKRPIILLSQIPDAREINVSRFYRYSYGQGPGPHVDLEQARTNAALAQDFFENLSATLHWHLGAARLERVNPKGATPAQSHKIHAHQMALVFFHQKRMVRIARERRAWRWAVRELERLTLEQEEAADALRFKAIELEALAGRLEVAGSETIARLFQTGEVFGMPAEQVRA